MTDAYDRLVVGNYSDGRNMVINRRTKAMLEVAEFELGFPLVITQGSYNTSVSQSGGTHDGGGVVDLRVTDFDATTREQVLGMLRSIGFISWYRTPAQGDWPYHIHIVAKGDAELSPAAKNQVASAEAGRNGLKSNLPDDDNLNVPTFDYEEFASMLQELVSRVAVLEQQVSGNTDARAQYAYAAVIEGGSVDKRLDTLEGRVKSNTDARAQYAYTAVVDGGSVDVRLDNVEGDVQALKAQVDALPKA